MRKNLKNRMTAFVASAGICVSMISGAFSSAVSAEAIVYSGYDTARLVNVLSEFEKSLLKQDNDDEVRRCYEQIINETDYLSSQIALAQVEYSLNMTQENYSEYIMLMSAAMKADEEISGFLSKGLGSSYRELLTELIGEMNIHNIENTESTSSEETAELAEKKEQLLRSYTEEAYSDHSAEEKNLKCAEIYLDTVKLLNSTVKAEGATYLDYAYYTYCRDYSPEDIAVLGDTVAESVNSAYVKVSGRLKELFSEASPDVLNIAFEDNMDVIRKYSSDISDELRASAEEVAERDLYKTASGTGSERKSYTSLLNYYDTAVIYQYLYNNYQDFTAAAHEFGHLNSMRLNCIPASRINCHNLDLAEVQSQGLEVLYTSFYGSIYGENDEIFKTTELLAMLTAVAAGFQGNEFEYYVFENADSMTPEQVVEKYSEIAAKYRLYNVAFYDVPHFFQYPGYYISYGVSALAALNLWDVMYRDFDEAADRYTALTHVSTYDGTGFSAALAGAGFDNILSEEYITSGISDLAEVVSSGRIYGDTDQNGIVNTADFMLLLKCLMNPSEYITEDSLRIFDVSNDGAVNAADIIRYRKIISK